MALLSYLLPDPLDYLIGDVVVDWLDCFTTVDQNALFNATLRQGGAADVFCALCAALAPSR